jgi:hypothetical protein
MSAQLARGRPTLRLITSEPVKVGAAPAPELKPWHSDGRVRGRAIAMSVRDCRIDQNGGETPDWAFEDYLDEAARQLGLIPPVLRLVSTGS